MAEQPEDMFDGEDMLDGIDLASLLAADFEAEYAVAWDQAWIGDLGSRPLMTGFASLLDDGSPDEQGE